MKNRIIVTIAIACICYADASATAPFRSRGRGLRKEVRAKRSIPEEEVSDEICVNLGPPGRQTFVVPRSKLDYFTTTIRRSRGATLGACDQRRTTELSKMQRRVICYHFASGEDFTVYAPRALRRWLAKRGVYKGECKNDTGADIHIRLQLEQVGTILGHTWRATHLCFEDTGLQETLPDHPATLLFDSESKVYGQASCNNCRGSIALLTDDQIKLSMLATTKMLCHPEDVMQQEFVFVKVMSKEKMFYEITGGGQVLTLYEILLDVDGNENRGDVMANFTRVVD